MNSACPNRHRRRSGLAVNLGLSWGQRAALVASVLAWVGTQHAAAQSPIYGPITNPGNNHRYYLLSASTWTAAEAAAVSLGGHLATLRNQAEQDWIYGNFANFGGTPRNLWIGLHDPQRSINPTDLVWVSGEPVTYTHWASGEPNNSGGDEFFGHLWLPGYSVSGFWNDISDTSPGYTLNGVAEISGPRITCPPEFLVGCIDSDISPTVTGSATATTVCGGLSITYADAAPIRTAASVETIIRTWTAQDVCGISTCEQKILRLLGAPPTVTLAQPELFYGGASAVFTATVSAFPPATLTWLFNGNTLTPGVEGAQFTQEGNQYRLELDFMVFAGGTILGTDYTVSASASNSCGGGFDGRQGNPSGVPTFTLAPGLPPLASAGLKGVTASRDRSASCGTFSASSRRVGFKASQDGVAQVSTLLSPAPRMSASFGPAYAATELACSPGKVRFSVLRDRTYWIDVDAGGQDFDLITTLRNPPPCPPKVAVYSPLYSFGGVVGAFKAQVDAGDDYAFHWLWQVGDDPAAPVIETEPGVRPTSEGDEKSLTVDLTIFRGGRSLGRGYRFQPFVETACGTNINTTGGIGPALAPLHLSIGGPRPISAVGWSEGPELNVGCGSIPSGVTWFPMRADEAGRATVSVTGVSPAPLVVAFDGSLFELSEAKVIGCGNGQVSFRVNRDWAYWIAVARPSSSLSLTLALEPANTDPTVGAIADQSIPKNTSTGFLFFTVADRETPAQDLKVTAASSDEALVPASGIVLGGAGANRSLQITPAPDRTGSAILTVRVVDAEGAQAQQSFRLNVYAPNEPPTVGVIPDQVIRPGSFSASAIAFTVADAETPAAQLRISLRSSNPALFPERNLLLGGSGASRTILPILTPGATGAAEITVTVTDTAGGTATRVFVIAVRPPLSLGPATITAAGRIEFTVAGLTGEAHNVEYSEDLLTWRLLRAISAGQQEFTVSEPITSRQGYFRVRRP